MICGPSNARGASLVEYALIIALIAILSVAVLSAVGGRVSFGLDETALVLVDDGMPTCSSDERTAWRAAWNRLVEQRDELQARNQWLGAANRATRVAWIADRDTLREIQARFGC